MLLPMVFFIFTGFGKPNFGLPFVGLDQRFDDDAHKNLASQRTLHMHARGEQWAFWRRCACKAMLGGSTMAY
jgi:hypothetical protein